MVCLATAGLLFGACSGGAPEGAVSPTPEAVLTPSASTDELVEVAPGRFLAVTCSGEGEPTVFYLHGLIQPQDSASWAHSPELRSRLDDETRYCEYERANVGEALSWPDRYR